MVTADGSENEEFFALESLGRGYYVYKSIWTPVVAIRPCGSVHVHFHYRKRSTYRETSKNEHFCFHLNFAVT